MCERTAQLGLLCRGVGLAPMSCPSVGVATTRIHMLSHCTACSAHSSWNLCKAVSMRSPGVESHARVFLSGLQDGSAVDASVRAVVDIVSRLMEIVSACNPSKFPPGEAAAVLAEYALLGAAQRQHLLDVRIDPTRRAYPLSHRAAVCATHMSSRCL